MPIDSRRLPVPENSTPPCVLSNVSSPDIVKPVFVDYDCSCDTVQYTERLMDTLDPRQWSSLKTDPAPAGKNTARVFKSLATTDTHQFIQLFL